jgi:hypothetical protein
MKYIPSPLPRCAGELTTVRPLTNGQRIAQWFERKAEADNKVKHVFRVWPQRK